jgi:hypothetical protein
MCEATAAATSMRRRAVVRPPASSPDSRRAGPVPGAAAPRSSIIDAKREPSEAVLAMCRRCPVREECLAFALADPTLEGV